MTCGTYKVCVVICIKTSREMFKLHTEFALVVVQGTFKNR